MVKKGEKKDGKLFSRGHFNDLGHGFFVVLMSKVFKDIDLAFTRPLADTLIKF